MKTAIITLILACVVAFGGFVSAMEYRYGSRMQVVSNSREILRINLKRLIRNIEQRIWDLQKQFGFDFRKYPSQYAREFQKLMSELEILKAELTGL